MHNTPSYSYYIIYKTTCIVNQKYYIGCHKTNNLDDGYIGSGTIFKQAVKKFGKENFVREILFELSSEEEMFKKEMEIVSEDIVNDPESYNLVVGGSGGFKVLDIESWKTKLKSSSAKRKNKSPAAGLVHTAETKQKISNAVKGKPAWNKGLPGTWTGKSHSAESKQRISESRKGITAGEKNPMYGKSAVAGRKWYNDGVKTYYLYPTDPATSKLIVGRLRKPSS